MPILLNQPQKLKSQKSAYC